MCAFLGALGELGNGGCGVVVPDAFSCRSMPEWAAFLEAVTQNRNQNFQEDPLLALHAQDVFCGDVQHVYNMYLCMYICIFMSI